MSASEPGAASARSEGRALFTNAPDKLCIIMVGLPARGKSTVAGRLYEALSAEGVRTRVFNNGELRRRFLGPQSSLPEFYSPENAAGRAKREGLARINAEEAGA